MATYRPKIKLDTAGNTEAVQLPISAVSGLNDTLEKKANSADLAKVATSGSYADLTNKPTIPTVNNGTLTVTQNGTSKGTFTANQSTNTTIALTDTTYSNATITTAGLMSSADKSKLDGIASGANKITVDSALSSTSTNPVQNKVINSALASKQNTLTAGANITISGNTISATDTNTTYTFASGDNNGTIKVTPSGGTAQNVAVKGLGSAAYTASTAYATSAQGTKADNAVPNTRKVNGKALSADITLSASDVGALASGTTYVSSVNGASGAVTDVAKTNASNTFTGNQSVTGNLTVGGNLVVNGSNTTVNSNTLAVKDKLIEVASGNTVALTTPAGLVAPKYDGTNSGAMVFDASGTAYVGDVVLDSSGNIVVASSSLQPLATRSAESALTNGHLMQWDSTNKKLVDSGLATSAVLTSHQDISGKQDKLTAGTNITISGSTISAKDTTYSVATTSANGLMSASDKTKLDGIASGANKTTVDTAMSSTSTNPVQNKVVNSAISGKTNTSVMPNNSGDIKTKFRCSQRGYTAGATWYYKLCTLPANDAGNYASAIISGRIGGWVASNLSYINALAWNRDGAGIALMDIAGTTTAMSGVWNIGDLVMYVNSDNTATLYVKCYNYFTFDLDIELFQSGATLTYDGTYVTSVSGTLSAQASTTTKRVEIVNGKLLVNGSAVALESAIPTNYAGSSSAGGSATSAVKLDTTTAGSATQPVYFSDGKPVATTYTLGASVPSGAKFTDTDTGYTSITTTGSGNAITAISGSGRALTATKGTTFLTSHQSLANYVTLNGTQEITGAKTFTSNVKAPNFNSRFALQSVPYGTPIGSNVNLNTTTYLRVGNYYCSSDAAVKTLTNCPTSSAFMMTVYSPLTTTVDNETTSTWVYRVRKLMTYGGDEFIQMVNSGSTAGTFTYGAWKKIAKTTDIPTNYVTTNTEQEISAWKFFSDGIDLSSHSRTEQTVLNIYDNEGTGSNLFGVTISGDGSDTGTVYIGSDDTGGVELQLANDAGTSGQVLTSQGAGKTPKWSDAPKIVNISLGEGEIEQLTSGGKGCFYIRIVGRSLSDLLQIIDAEQTVLFEWSEQGLFDDASFTLEIVRSYNSSLVYATLDVQGERYYKIYNYSDVEMQPLYVGSMSEGYSVDMNGVAVVFEEIR